MTSQTINQNIGRFFPNDFLARARIVPAVFAAGITPSAISFFNPSPLPVYSTSAVAPSVVELTMDGIERLTRAAFIAPSTIELEFVDRRSFSLSIELLEMPLDCINWSTLAVAPSGGNIVVNGIKGDPIPINAATIRYLVDQKYAVHMDYKLRSLQFSEDELERLVRNNPPPDAWLDETETDSAHESW